jgi:hypothetical protein
MNKIDTTEIREVIEHILEYRSKEIFENENIYTNTYDYKEKDRLNAITIDKYDKPLVKLNNLLKQEYQYKEVLEIEKQMMKIQSKKNISVKEFAEIYNVSKTSQQNYRGRIHDPLPYHQKVEGGKIVYNVEEVERWFENQHK